jgi:hypothetical protein
VKLTEHFHVVPIGEWNYSSTAPYVFIALYFVKHRDNFAFNPVRAYKGVMIPPAEQRTTEGTYYPVKWQTTNTELLSRIIHHIQVQNRNT